jgi:50S ribosomal protein L16 3-hydroxylase
MDAVTDCQLDTYDPEVFFSSFWRQKPMFVKGGGKDFLGRRWSEDDFDAAYATARAQGHPITERPGEVTFIENVSAFDSDLGSRATELAAVFAAPTVWFDAIRTYGPSGIGSHFDHSDNFVLQQDGVKEWTLAPPANLDKEQIARRMMNVAGVGSAELPDEGTVRFVLEPGDLMYIPLLWLHSGVSREQSLSLSVVSPAVSLQSAVLPLLDQACKQRALGYQPIPAFHAYLTEDARQQAAEALRSATRAMLRHLSDESLLATVAAMQRSVIPGIAEPPS